MLSVSKSVADIILFDAQIVPSWPGQPPPAAAWAWGPQGLSAHHAQGLAPALSAVTLD